MISLRVDRGRGQEHDKILVFWLENYTNAGLPKIQPDFINTKTQTCTTDAHLQNGIDIKTTQAVSVSECRNYGIGQSLTSSE